jgi:fermentation-respiration switch protein FrsA (DUF1100 family)
MVACPTLIIHGKKDELIPPSHAVTLYGNCGGPAKLHMPAEMTHNDFAADADVFDPMKIFFLESNI